MGQSLTEPERRHEGSIEQLIADAHEGDRTSLVLFCERIRVLVLAIELHVGQSWKDAVAAVPAHLRLLGDHVLNGQLRPDHWREHIVSLVQTAARMEGAHGGDDHPGLSGLAAIPRMAKRRSVRKAMTELPLWNLTAVLAVHLNGASPKELAGFVADSEQEAREVLISAHQALQQAMQDGAPEAP